MNDLSRRCTAFTVAAVLIFSQFCAPIRATAARLGIPTTARHAVVGAAAGHAPLQRIAIPEPPRRTPLPMRPPTAIHAGIIYGVHPAHGLPGNPPPLLRPSEIDRMLSAARRRASLPLARRPVAAQSVVVRPVTLGGTRASAAPGKSGARATHSIRSSSGTGINPWWRYQEETIPGVGRAMINVGTGNLLLQADDMSVPHKGVSLAFRRTYNSQSQHDVAGTDGGPPTMSGNGWTNTFDAHITGSKTGTMTVWDIDGARYDYTLAADGITRIPPPGQHAILVYDGYCGYYWTKKSGTTYVFWGPDVPSCPTWWYPTFGAYAGRTYQIIGRNRNTNITFSYSWDNGNSAPGGKISTITAQTESGLTATLSFADVSGHRLLQQLVFPDGVTSVNYYYYPNGDLGDVVSPTNNAGGTRPDHSFGYTPFGTGTILLWASSPRWCASTCGTDGAWTRFDFTGNDHPSATLIDIGFAGVVNPSIPDGSNQTVLQPGYPTGAVGYLSEFFTTGVSTPTFRDSDGHATNWVVDSFGRPTQTQECTATTGGSCTGTWLVSNEMWDANNNLVSSVDPRNFETDYAYDSMGNTIAVAQPQVTTSQGTFRPTSLFSYDSFNNVTAYCDPDASHALSSDWTVAPSGDALCPVTSSLAARFIWSTDPTQSGTSSANPSYEPFGELLARIEPATPAAPGGYRVNYTYDPSRQGGADDGLPTTVAAAVPMTQADGTQRQPTQSFWYDSNGWLGCYNTGSGAWVLAYDALGRLLSAADPDDSAAGAGICNKTGGMAGWSTASTTAYFPDGSVSTKQSASQRAAGVSSAFTYDADGNERSETHHFGCVLVSSCTAGVTNKWYDGADRLVEVSLPYDANDIQGYPMMTRYIYDLSRGGTTQYQNLGLQGYGNLVKTQELLSGTVITPFTYATYSSFVPYQISTGAWTDVRATSFDGLDRSVSAYEAAFGNQPKVTNTYDGPPPAGGNAQLGLLTSVRLATNEVKQYTYDVLGHLTDTTYSNDNGATSPVHVRYDASGRVISRGTDAMGNEVLQYDAAGELTSVTKPASLGSATITYDYYSDGMRKDLNFASAAYSASPLFQYSYRTDGRRSALKLNNGSAFTWSFTPTGRLQSQTDPLTGRAIAPDNYYTIGQSATKHPYYPSSVTYVPETYSFDTYGRTIGVTLPAGVFSQSVSGFDLEDGVSGMTGLSVQAPTNVTTVTCATSNVRNEKLPTNNGGCLGRFYNGATFAVQQSAIPDNQGNGLAPWTLDARAGMLKSWQGPTEPSGNASSGQFAYDASGRLTGDTEQLDRPWRASDGTMAGNRVYSTGTRTKTYDAENRLRSQQTSPAAGATFPLWGENNPGGYWNDVGQGARFELQAVDYSADSHPVRFAATYTPDFGNSLPTQTLIWLWDGNDVLAQCGYDNSKTQCATYGFSVEGLANYYPSNGYIAVQDRGLSGQIVATHDVAQFTGMKPLGRNARNYFFGGVNATGAPNSAYPDTASGLPGGNATVTGTKIAVDGWTFDNNTWQGVRTYDASVGQWNTPDAYAGDVHDPMSQKPFMWNRNNPYLYADPSGFSPVSDGAMAVLNFVILDDWRTASDSKAGGWARALAVASLVSNLGGPEVKGGEFVLKSIIKISEKQLQHTADHFVESAVKKSGKFSAGTTTADVRGMVEHAIEGARPGDISVSQENIKILTDFGRTIGTSGKKETSLMASFYDLDGNFLSAYPVKK